MPNIIYFILMVNSVVANSNFYDLVYQEQQIWMRKFNYFKIENTLLFEEFIDIHVNHFNDFHNSDKLFFSFHEIYLDLFNYISDIQLYYWDFYEISIQKYIEDFGGFGIFCQNNICYQRIFRTSKLDIKKYNNKKLDDIESYTIFMRDQVHNKIHQYIGGTMISPYSPRDILFYPFHMYMNILYQIHTEFDVQLYREETKTLLLNSTYIDEFWKQIIYYL